MLSRGVDGSKVVLMLSRGVDGSKVVECWEEEEGDGSMIVLMLGVGG